MRKSLRLPFLLGILSIVSAGWLPSAQAQMLPSSAKAPPVGPAAPQSKHFPILLIASGTEPFWSARIGMKGPDRIERVGYPPIVLEPGEIVQETAGSSWTYHAKDIATSAEVALHLTREPCSDSMSDTKYTFRAALDHSQIGVLKGCARIAPDQFPEFKQKNLDDDDPAKTKPALPAVTKFVAPASFAFINGAGKIIFVHGALKKIVGSEGTELAVSHSGKQLLYTRSDSKTGPERTIVLYDFETGRSKDVQHGLVRQSFWSPDDSRIAFLKGQDQKWQVWSFPAASPEKAAQFSSNSVDALHGWVDLHSVLASAAQDAFWLNEDKPAQIIPLKEIYGDAFQIMGSDALRINPANPDLLLVSADYLSAPSGAQTDAMGLTSTFFLYEIRSKRRVVLGPSDQWARAAEWSRDGIQIFYTRRVSAAASSTFRMFWDASGLRRYQEGTDLVVGQ